MQSCFLVLSGTRHQGILHQNISIKLFRGSLATCVARNYGEHACGRCDSSEKLRVLLLYLLHPKRSKQMKPTTSAVVEQCPPRGAINPQPTAPRRSKNCLIRPAPAIDRQTSPPSAILPDLYTKACLLLQHQGLSHAPTSTAQASQSTDWVFGSSKRGESGPVFTTSSLLDPSWDRELRSTLYDKKTRSTLSMFSDDHLR